jgi:hypothetical protein
MNQELRAALDDADKWYELYLGQKFANERLVKELHHTRAELLKAQQYFELTSELLDEAQRKELIYG